MEGAAVAVITRTKDRPVTLKRAIASVGSQTFRDYIHVIVNDGGNPKDVDELVSGCSPDIRQRIRVIHNAGSLGMEAASNIGIRACESKYILIHDDDDSLLPEFLEETIAFMEANGSAFCGVSSWMLLVKETIKDDTITTVSEKLYSSKKSVSIGEMSVSNQLVPIAFLYKRSMHEEIGFYDETLPVLGDWDFFLRLLERYDIGILPKILAHYHQRISTDGIYANSLTGAIDKHAVYTQVVRNKFFRREAQAGKPGIGFLSQISSLMQTLPFISAENYVKGTIHQVLLNRADCIAIYGTGNIAAQLYYELKNNRVTVGCFVENDSTKINGTFMNIPVVSLQEAVDKGYYDIAIGSWEYKMVIIDRIHEQLCDQKIRLRLFSD